MRTISPVSASIPATKVALIATCLYFDEETLIFSPLVGPCRHFKCKTASVPTALGGSRHLPSTHNLLKRLDRPSLCIRWPQPDSNRHFPKDKLC